MAVHFAPFRSTLYNFKGVGSERFIVVRIVKVIMELLVCIKNHIMDFHILLWRQFLVCIKKRNYMMDFHVLLLASLPEGCRWIKSAGNFRA